MEWVDSGCEVVAARRASGAVFQCARMDLSIDTGCGSERPQSAMESAAQKPKTVTRSSSDDISSPASLAGLW